MLDRRMERSTRVYRILIDIRNYIYYILLYFCYIY